MLVYPNVRGLTWKITRSPKWDTLVQRMSSGKEFRVQYWVYPLWTWQLEYGYLKDNPSDLPLGYSATDLAVLQGFFNQMAGQSQVFLFDDFNAGETAGAGQWDSVANQAIATGDSVTTTFQMIRTSGGFPEAIQQPWPNSSSKPPVVKVAGATKSYGTDYSIDATGNIIFTSAPTTGQAITASFSYYWPVRFGTDELDFEAMMYQLRSLKKVTLQQVRL
jgi:uncharacterized protein (TIGR02217 family)